MTPFEAIVLGVVEGVTEFLPVSSTGHLILAQHVLGIADSPAIQAFEICVQAGAIAAVLAVFLPRVLAVARGLAGRDPAGARLAFQLALAFVPAAVCGVLFKDAIKAHLFGLWPVVAAWFAGGVVILAWPLLRRGRAQGGVALEALGWRAAFGIGLAQCLALWPGTSRSLATIAGALALGLASTAAVEFSLLLGFVTLAAATAHQAHEHGAAMLRELGAANLALGFGAAFLSAWAAVRGLVHLLERGGLAAFGWYRIALALVVAALVVRGVLPS